MLRELHVRDLALIEEAQLEFGPGLNALTGETGAGKTVLVEALDLLLGARGDSGLVRDGAERLELEAAFELEGGAGLRDLAEEEGLELEGEEIILRRVIGKDGRGRCYVNGRMCTVGSLARLSEYLVDIHGQHEHQRLLQPSSHLEYLDAYGDAKHRDLLGDYRDIWRRWRDASDLLRESAGSEAERLREIDLLRFQISEIEAADPREGEMEELLAERKRMQNREELFTIATGAYMALSGEEGGGGVLGSLGAAESLLDRGSRMDEGVEEWSARIMAAGEQIADVSRELRSYIDSLDFEPGRLEEVEIRLRTLGDLARKYGGDTRSILEHLEMARSRLQELEGLDGRRDDLEREVRSLGEDLREASKRLSSSRGELAAKLQRAANRELRELNMAGMRLRVDLKEAGEFREAGADSVEFVISPAKDLTFRPIGRIASGGELSRIMLALKLSLARADEVPTLVFDEVDAGIGGATADVLAEKLARISAYHQVFSITHLPQIAAFSDRHLSVSKRETKKGVVTEVEVLEEERRVEELARMLGGDGATAREHAVSMLESKPSPQR